MALGGAWLLDNKHYALNANFGTFRGESGFGATGLIRITDNLLFSVNLECLDGLVLRG